MVYYGVMLNVSSWAGDVFVNNAIGGAVEIPAYLICVPLLYWGRRNSLALMLCLAGITLFTVPWLPPNGNEPFCILSIYTIVDIWIGVNWLRVTLGMAGKLFITSSFAIVYVITGEIYPTNLRANGVAISSCIARVGSALAPFVSSLHKFVCHIKQQFILKFTLYFKNT